MLHINIDGKDVEVQDGVTIMEAANQVGIYIPHFCYHKKLSIAANCRMCLVQVEKAAKPLPACATPVTDGMKVMTRSDTAIRAQKGVMEFLLINHPLDCPICDQGGECQLQDLAVGYGSSKSRYQEEKRVVPNKNLGPLISTDMTRCIHCTRCVRFGQEIAGIMELGMVGRGEHAEIMPFVERTVNSELSGNVIDLCPVGALTSKPFRYTARTWELSRRKSISPHDSLGSNLIVQVKQNRVMRVLPAENEGVNECWLSDRDRFSYEALNTEERLTKPLIKRDGHWSEVEWQEALEHVANGLSRIRSDFGAKQIGALLSPGSTVEELYLAQKLMRGMGSGNVDHRLRQSDFALDRELKGTPWLGLPVADLTTLDRILVVGSNLRKEHPLLAHRVRQAVKNGAELSVIGPTRDEWLTRITHPMTVSPRAMVRALASVVKAVRAAKGEAEQESLKAIEVSEEARAIADSLLAGERKAVLLGNMTQHHPAYSALVKLGLELGRLTGAHFGVLNDGGNSVGGYVAGAVPMWGAKGTQTIAGMNAREMLDEGLKAYLLLGVEPELDCYNPQKAIAAMQGAELVVAMSAFKSRAPEYATVILPIAPFTETSGTFVNIEGRIQSFHGVVKPQGEARPAWKVLRVLGNLLGLKGFDFESTEAVREEVLGKGEASLAGLLDCSLSTTALPEMDAAVPTEGLQRIGDVPIYDTDPIVRRAPSLRKTHDAAAPVASMHSSLLDKLGLVDGALIAVRQNGGQAILRAVKDDGLPADCVRVAAGHTLTAGLGGMFDEISIERA